MLAIRPTFYLLILLIKFKFGSLIVMLIKEGEHKRKRIGINNGNANSKIIFFIIGYLL